MSHVVDGECVITDLDACESACSELGLKLVRGQTTFAWYGTWVNDYQDPHHAAALKGHDPAQFGRCSHVIRRQDHREGDYEIGLTARRDGQPGFEVLYDSWGEGGRRIEERAGKFLSKFKVSYQSCVATRQLSRKGYRVQRVQQPGGGVKLIATKA